MYELLAKGIYKSKVKIMNQSKKYISNIIVLYILIFKFLESSLEDKSVSTE